jgi:hypothetical protein
MPNINGTKQLGDFEYQKFRGDSTGKPAVAVVNADGSNISTGVATATNQEQIAELLEQLITENQSLKAILRHIETPDYLDKITNQLRAQVTGSLTTLTTVTTLTNVGTTYNGDLLQRSADLTAWATNTRSLIT